MKLFLRVFIPGLMFSLSSLAGQTPLKFEKALFAELKTANLQQVFCKNKSTLQLQTACKELAVAPGGLDWKAEKIKVLSEKSFSIQAGGVMVEVARTSKANEYEVNHRKISLLEYPGIKELKAAVQKALPSTAKKSVWMNQAYAADKDPAVETMSTTIALVLTATSDKEICEAATRVATICEDYPGRSISAKTVTKILSVVSQRIATQGMKTSVAEAASSGMSEAERKAFNAALSHMQNEKKELEVNLEHLQDRKKMLMSCPSARETAGGSAWSDIQSCRSAIQSSYEFTAQFAKGMLNTLRATDKDLENIAIVKEKLRVAEPADTPSQPGAK